MSGFGSSVLSAVVLAVGVLHAGGLAAQATPTGSSGGTSACSLLSVPEIKSLLGERTPQLIDMIPPNEERLASGGSECFIATIIIQLNAVQARNFTSNMEAYAGRTTYERMTGVGDEAYFYQQGAGTSNHVVGVYSRVGQHVLVVSMDVGNGDTPESLRPSLTTLSQAAEAKLR